VNEPATVGRLILHHGAFGHAASHDLRDVVADHERAELRISGLGFRIESERGDLGVHGRRDCLLNRARVEHVREVLDLVRRRLIEARAQVLKRRAEVCRREERVRVVGGRRAGVTADRPRHPLRVRLVGFLEKAALVAGLRIGSLGERVHQLDVPEREKRVECVTGCLAAGDGLGVQVRAHLPLDLGVDLELARLLAARGPHVGGDLVPHVVFDRREIHAAAGEAEAVPHGGGVFERVVGHLAAHAGAGSRRRTLGGRERVARERAEAFGGALDLVHARGESLVVHVDIAAAGFHRAVERGDLLRTAVQLAERDARVERGIAEIAKRRTSRFAIEFFGADVADPRTDRQRLPLERVERRRGGGETVGERFSDLVFFGAVAEALRVAAKIFGGCIQLGIGLVQRRKTRRRLELRGRGVECGKLERFERSAQGFCRGRWVGGEFVDRGV